MAAGCDYVRSGWDVPDWIVPAVLTERQEDNNAARGYEYAEAEQVYG